MDIFECKTLKPIRLLCLSDTVETVEGTSRYLYYAISTQRQATEKSRIKSYYTRILTLVFTRFI